MSRPHDLGGRRGFGAVPVEDSEAFHEAWEARIFGIVRAFRSNGYLTTDEWRDALESLPPSVYLSSRYFHRWVVGLEKVAVDAGVLEEGEVDAVLASWGDDAR